MKLSEISFFKIDSKKAYGKFGFEAWEYPFVTFSRFIFVLYIEYLAITVLIFYISRYVSINTNIFVE